MLFGYSVIILFKFVDICETEGGYGPCMFPFAYDGIEYNTCVPSKGLKKPWCAYTVHEDGVMKDWDRCGQGNGCKRTGKNKSRRY